MSKISDSQRDILKAACKKPKTDIREFMKHMPNTHVRDKVVNSMLNNRLVVEDPDAEGVVYIISEAGYATIGKKPPVEVAEEKPVKQEAEIKAPVKKRKSKREGSTKKQIMIDMLSREDGATKEELMAALGWQKHSVQGGISNLNDELIEEHQQTIVSTMSDGKNRTYKIVPYNTEQKEPAKEDETA